MYIKRKEKMVVAFSVFFYNYSLVVTIGTVEKTGVVTPPLRK